RPVGLAGGLAVGKAVVRGRAGEDMHVERELHLLRRGPELVVPRVDVEVVGRCSRGNAHAYGAHALAALHLTNRLVWVEELDAAETEQPPGLLVAIAGD